MDNKLPQDTNVSFKMPDANFTPAPWKTGQVSWDEETKDVRYTLHGIKEALK